MSQEMEKNSNTQSVIISSTVLGQKRAEYERLSDKGLSEKRIASRMEEDALQFGVSIEDYQHQLESLKTRGGNGENLEEKRRDHTSKINVDFLDLLGNLNGIMIDDTVKGMTYSKVNFTTLKNAIQRVKTSLETLSQDLSNTDFTTYRGKQGWMVMLHAPAYDFINASPVNPQRLFAPFIGGWSDKGRSYDQYGTRMEAGGKATFYRSISYETPVTPVSNSK
jgi:archaellum component FlaC